MSKLRVAVLYGGPSREHEVSIKTGETMLANLDASKYQVEPVFISKTGEWKINGEMLDVDKAIEHLQSSADFALIGLHGTFGEDGQVQAILESAGIAYSGSDSAVSRRVMAKHEAARVYRSAGLTTPDEVLINDPDTNMTPYLKRFGFPLVVKPVAQGSSFGVSIVDDEADLPTAIEFAFREDNQILLQQYIKGREVSCGVIEDEQSNLIVLPPTEMIPLSSRFFDYNAKYEVGGAEEVTPPDNMSQDMIERIQHYSRTAHSALGCSCYSRTDMIVAGDELYIIETNTLPGLTATSILPQQAAAQKISFPVLLDMVIAAGLRRSGV